MEIHGTDAVFHPLDKDKAKNGKRFRWLLLLRAHKAFASAACFGNTLSSLLHSLKKRLLHRSMDKSSKGRILFRVILTFLLMALAFLSFEFLADFKGWRYFQGHIPRTSEIKGFFHNAYVSWLEFRAGYIAPPIQSLSTLYVALFLVQSLDRMLLCLGCFWIKLKKIRPNIQGDLDLELEGSNSEYPMVYEQSISVVCELDWPKDRLLIQVMDDSDDEGLQWLIKGEVSKWSHRGVNIIYRHRLFRTGYKAGNLKSAMKDTMSVTKFNAMVSGLFQLGSSYEWIVTKKAGRLLSRTC